MSKPIHICPKCREAQVPEAFINAKGKRVAWCSWCRQSYRGRFIKPKPGREAKPSSIDTDAIAKQEGYAGHPLAQLLALSHIAGAKRALAIRDGKSWKGKKAWGAYYRAKRTLEEMLAPREPTVTVTLPAIPADHEWFVYRGNPEGRLIKDEALSKLINGAGKRDP